LGLVVVALIVFQIAIRLLPLTHLEESEEDKPGQVTQGKRVGTEVSKV
jgi:hypothetical protein